MTTRALVSAGIAASCLLLATACTTDAPDTTAGETNTPAPASSETVRPVNTTPVVASEVILTEAEAPAGYTFNDVGAFLDEQAAAEENEGIFDVLTGISADTVTDPPQCSGLIPTAVDTLIRVKDTRELTEAVEYTSEDEEVVITALVTTDDGLRAPEDVTGCASFTRTIGSGEGQHTVTYQAHPLSVDVSGAETLTAVELGTSDASLEAAQESGTLIAAGVDGAYVHLHASGPVDTGVLEELAQAQIDKITHR